MRKKSAYGKSALSKILKAEKRKKGISLLKAYKDLNVSQVSFLRRLQLKDKTIKDIAESKRIAKYFSIPEESVHMSLCGQDTLAMLFYENPEIIPFLKDMYEKSKTSNIKDLIYHMSSILKENIEKTEGLSEMALIKKMYLSGEDISNISKTIGFSYQTVFSRLKVIKDNIEM